MSGRCAVGMEYGGDVVLGLLKVCGMFSFACLHSSRAATKPTHAWKTSRHICAHTRVRNLMCVNTRVVTRPSPMLLTEPNIKTAPTPTRYKAICVSLHPLGLPLCHPISPVPCIPVFFFLCAPTPSLPTLIKYAPPVPFLPHLHSHQRPSALALLLWSTVLVSFLRASYDLFQGSPVAPDMPPSKEIQLL